MSKYVRALREDLRSLIAEAACFRTAVAQEQAARVTDGKTRNQLQQEDLVMMLRVTKSMRPTKLTPKYAGSYKVEQQIVYEISCRRFSLRSVEKFYVGRCNIYHGTRGDILKLAAYDYDWRREIRKLYYIRSVPYWYLLPLYFTALVSWKFNSHLLRETITTVEPGDLFFLGMLWFGMRRYMYLMKTR